MFRPFRWSSMSCRSARRCFPLPRRTRYTKAIWDGALPGHRSGKYKDRDVFYSSYIQTYIDRDVSTDIPGVDKVMFADFIRAAACRSGQMLNLHDIAGDIGVSDDTAKRWMKELEKSGDRVLSAPLL